MNRIACLLAGPLLAGGLAFSAPASAQVTADRAWSRATPPRGTTGVVYLALTSKSDDALVAVSTPAAAMAELHQTQMAGTVMQMRPVEGGLALPAGRQVTLAPGGTHIMLMGLKAPLKPGAALPLHLVFRTAPAIDVVAHVQAVGAPDAMAGMH